MKKKNIGLDSGLGMRGPTALRISRAATVDRYGFRTETARQNRRDLAAAQRRQLQRRVGRLGVSRSDMHEPEHRPSGDRPVAGAHSKAKQYTH